MRTSHMPATLKMKGWRVRPDGRWETDVPIVQKHRFQVAVWFETKYVSE